MAIVTKFQDEVYKIPTSQKLCLPGVAYKVNSDTGISIPKKAIYISLVASTLHILRKESDCFHGLSSAAEWRRRRGNYRKVAAARAGTQRKPIYIFHQ
jgi:hypothetical protein